MEQTVCPIEGPNEEDEPNCGPRGRQGSSEHFILFKYS